jgi:hypothetical protein
LFVDVFKRIDETPWRTLLAAHRVDARSLAADPRARRLPEIKIIMLSTKGVTPKSIRDWR